MNAKPGEQTIKAIEEAPKLSDETLNRFEEEHQCQLPDDYRAFLLEHNGGFPSIDCVTFEEAGRMTAADVACFHAVGDLPPWASLAWHIEVFSDRLPKDTLPIAHDSCGNLWLLSVGPDRPGSVLFWDHGTFANVDETDFDAWPQVASSFEEFLGQLSEYQFLPDEEALKSRYALVQLANRGMAKQSPDFNQHEVHDFAWHCEVNDQGKLDMQLVQYAPHAAVVHTDGYSRLRAAEGLIDEGPARLPE